MSVQNPILAKRKVEETCGLRLVAMLFPKRRVWFVYFLPHQVSISVRQ